MKGIGVESLRGLNYDVVIQQEISPEELDNGLLNFGNEFFE